MKDLAATAMELTNLYGEALNLRALRPHTWIRPNQLVVVQDPETDTLGYCVFDKEGDLNVYLGPEGLKSYLDEFAEHELEHQKHGFQVSFSPLSGLESDDFSLIERMDFNFRHNGELPKFRNFTIGFLPDTIRTGWQARFLTEAIKQLELIIRAMQKGLEQLEVTGSEVILCTHTPADEWCRLKVPMEVFLEQLQDSKYLYKNDLEAYRINRLPTMNMTFEVTQFYIPTPVKKTRISRGFYPLVTAAFETSTKQIVFAEITDSSRESLEAVLAKFAKTILNDLQFKPKYLVSDSESVIDFFQDFCDRTHISAQTVPNLETVNGFMEDLMRIKDEEELGAITFSSGFEDEIDTVLETAREICQTILTSNLLTHKLTGYERQQFISIVELLHVVMLSNFHELPDHWTVSHVEQALRQIFPTLLTVEEMELVPDILYHYVEIVGDAQMLPNYFEIKELIQNMYELDTKKQHG